MATRIDPLDKAGYDPVRHLNFIFSKPSSLTRLKEVQEHVDLYRSVIDEELEAIVPQYSPEEEAIIARAVKSPNQVESLIETLNHLKISSKETGKVIQESTKDIKRLDNTKSNLTQAMTVLKRLQMLTTAYGQLNGLIRTRKYKEMSQTLPAVMQLMSHFKSFRSIQQVAMLSKQVAEAQTQISEQIFADFSTVIEGKTDNPRFSEISGALVDACKVVDVLPNDQRQQLITWYCNIQLREFRHIFKTSDEAGSLENISRRYAYVKRMIKRHSEEMDQYFVPSWNMSIELTNAFCKATKEDINVLLTNLKDRDANVQLLLTALQETLEFEHYLEKRFNRPSYSKIISSAFESHLNIWIHHQDKILSEKFAQYRAPTARDNNNNSHDNHDGDSEDDSSRPTVLPSSADLFIFYRQVLAQTAKISTGPILVDLAFLFGRWLSTYCYQILKPLIPDHRINSTDDLLTVCLVLNTADYCLTTTSQLEQKLMDVTDSELKGKIDMENARNKFLETINVAIGELVSHVQYACELPFREMVNTNWTKLSSVGDQSSYVSSLRTTLEKETATIMQQINKDTYRRMLCDKVVDIITWDFLVNVARCKPISEISAEQMLLDLYVVKDSFLLLPFLTDSRLATKTASLAAPTTATAAVASASSLSLDETKPSNAYSRHVSRSLNRVEIVLKVILTVSEPANGLVQNYIYLIGDRSISNFTKILDLKGISRSQQNRFLDLFYVSIKEHSDLIEESSVLKNLRVFSSHSKSSSSVNNFSSPTSFEAPKVFSKEGLEKGFERFTHGSEAPVSKINENFRNIGRLFRRDGSGSPIGRRDAS